MVGLFLNSISEQYARVSEKTRMLADRTSHQPSTPVDQRVELEYEVVHPFHRN